jgi:hypothetical protein
MPDGDTKTARAPQVFVSDAVHVVRTAQTIQYQLSQMADQKASMLLGITFVIFTLSVGQAKDGHVPAPPVLILAGAAFLAASLTVLAVLPSVKAPPPSPDGRNLLFFGAFSQISEDAFVDAVMARLADPRSAYEIMVRDMYQNGRVLARKKYRLLGYAYRVLLAGLFLSLAAFVAPLLMRLAGA